MVHEFKDTGNGEHRLHAAPMRMEFGEPQLLLTGSRAECVAEYVRLCDDQPEQFEQYTFVVCDESGFPICAA